MNTHRPLQALCISSFLLVASSAAGLANRVFVSARSGNNANSCDNINTPCQTLAGAVSQLNTNGEVIVLDSGGYGPVTVTQGMTIEAPAGVTAFIHPPSGDAVTVNAAGATITLRGLVLNDGAGAGINVQAVGTLNVENCFITGFAGGIQMSAGSHLNVKGTDVKACGSGILIINTSGIARVSIDHCHLDDNAFGFFSQTTGPGDRSFTTATNSTANGNTQDGWHSGDFTSGVDQLHLEYCSASENENDGLATSSANFVTFSNCTFIQNGGFDIHDNTGNAILLSRGNNTARSINVGGGIQSLPPI